MRTYQVHGRTPADPHGPPRTPDAVRFLCEPKGGALSQELGSMILTLILDFSEHFVSLSYAAATTARGTFAAATTAHGTFAVSAHAALRRCRTRRRPAFLAISTDSRNFNSPRKLEMRRSRFSGTTDSAEASLQIARPIRGGGSAARTDRTVARPLRTFRTNFTAVRFLCEPKGGAPSQELGSRILTLQDFSEQSVSSNAYHRTPVLAVGLRRTPKCPDAQHMQTGHTTSIAAPLRSSSCAILRAPQSQQCDRLPHPRLRLGKLRCGQPCARPPPWLVNLRPHG